MFKRLLLASCLALLGASGLSAQNVVLPCVQVGTSCAPVNASNPLPVTSSGGGGTSDTNLTEINGTAISPANPLPVAQQGTVTVTGTVTATPTGTQAVSGTVSAAGTVASGATDSGNPVKVGAIYNTNLPTVSSGQRVDSQADSRGRLFVSNASGLLTTGQVSIGTTATIITPAATGNTNIRITNLGTVDVFCGPSGVSATTGELLVGTKGASLMYPTNAAVYCVVASGTETVSVALFN